MRQRCSILFMLVCVLAVAGCGGASGEDLRAGAEKLNTGDSTDRVLELCGSPDSKKDTELGEEWLYERTLSDDSGNSATLKVRVVVKNGSVIGVSRSQAPIR